MALQTVNELTSFFVTAGYDDLPRRKASTGFLSRWGKGPGSLTIRVDDALEFSMDIVRHKKYIGELMPRGNGEAMTAIGANAQTQTGQIFQNVARNFPIIRSYANVSHDEVMKYREPNELGVRSNQGTNLITKAGKKLGRAVNVNMVQDIGRLELAAAESLRTGKITLDDGVVAYDFGRASENTNTLTTLWSNVAALGFADLSTHYKKVQRNGGGDPRAVVMSGDSFNAFMNLTQVKASADSRDISFVRAGDAALGAKLPSAEFITDMEANGFTYQAYYRDISTGRKMYIFVYDEEYQDIDSADAWTPYMPSGKVLFFDPDMRLDRFFGPRIRFDYETPEESIIKRMLGINSMLSMPKKLGNGKIESWMWHHDVMPNANKTSFGIESYTSPLYACTEVDSAGELTVL